MNSFICFLLLLKDLMEDLESKVDDDVKNFLESQSSDTAAASEDAKRLHEAMKVLSYLIT